MQHQPRVFDTKTSNWASTSTGPGVMAGATGGRIGIFEARIGSTHACRLPVEIGTFAKGKKWQGSVQNLTLKKPEERDAAVWICIAHSVSGQRGADVPDCFGKSWPTKAACIAGHGDLEAVMRKQESHCIMALGAAPEDAATVMAAHPLSRGAGAATLITVDVPHGLKQHDVVLIQNVRGIPVVGMGDSGELTRLSNVEQRISNMIALGQKDQAMALMKQNPLTTPSEKADDLVALSCNGNHVAVPMSDTTFAIVTQLDGSFVKPKGDIDPKQGPRVVLRATRPILLSDTE